MLKSRSHLLKAFCLICSSLVYANPSDPVVALGSANFEQVDAHTLAINTSDQVVIQWRDFSIAENECAHFVQPSAQSVVINKVTSELSSALMGSLKANGKVFLFNSNGILIGEKGCIDTNGFIASTLSASFDDLLGGKDEVLFQGSSTASIVNLGKVTAWDGDVFLLSYKVENKGSILAPRGTAGVGAGQEVLLRPNALEKIVIRPSLVKYDDGSTGIDNSGAIEACRAELKADGNAYGMAIRHTGTIDALGIVEQNGEILLVTDEGNTGIYGSLTAKNGDETGGSIQLQGGHIALFENALLDTSGVKGGGPILIGGDLSGSNSDVLNAKTTYVYKGAQIISEAIQEGNAGKVIVWADETTCFFGKINARGGPSGGDGGFVEISGKQFLDFRGEADRFAPNGQSGLLLLDPTDIIYDFIGNTNSTAVSPFQPNGGGCSTIDSVSIDLALFTGPVTIQSSGTNSVCGIQPGHVIIDLNHTIASNFDLTFNTVVSGVTTGDITLNIGRIYQTNGPGNVNFISVQDININGTFINNGTGTTTLTAGRDININDGGSISNFGPSGGAMTFTAARDVNAIGGGAYGSGNVSGPFNITAGRDLIVTAAVNVAAVQLVDNILANRDITVTGTGNFAQINNLGLYGPLIMTAATGNITAAGGTSNANGWGVINSFDLTVNAPQGNIVVQGGPSGNGMNFAFINANSGSLHVNCSGSISVLGGTAPLGTGTATIENNGGPVFINAGGPINVVGGFCTVLGNNARITTGLSGGNINITTPSDVNLIGGVNPSLSNASIYTGVAGNVSIQANNVTLQGNNAQCGIESINGNLTIIANGAVTLLQGPSVTASYIWILPSPGTPELLVIAGTDIFIDQQNCFIQNFNSLGSLTLVCDNNFPTQPFFGPGKFTNLGKVSTSGAPLWVFTSRRFLNTTGIVNVGFTPGPIYVDSTSEKWFTWYNNNSNGVPYKIFYKDQPLPTPTQLQTALTVFNPAAYEFLQNLKDFDVFWYWRTTFDSFYDTDKYTAIAIPDELNSGEVFERNIYRLLRKSYKEQNGKVDYTLK